MGGGVKPKFEAKITRFDTDHPEFRLFRNGPARDPGAIKFNHALHLTPGLNLEPKGKPLLKLKNLAPGARERYRQSNQGDDEAVQLNCTSCHRFDGGVPGDSSAREPNSIADRPPARGGGQSPMAITYENQCRACHPLSYDPDRPDLSMRHGLQPAEVHRTLLGDFTERFLANRPEQRPSPPASRRVPGRAPAADEAAVRAIERKVAKVERILFGEKKCGECHVYVTPDGHEASAPTHWEEGSKVQIAPPNLPQVWLRHATFDHAPHLNLFGEKEEEKEKGCRECHAKEIDPNASRTSSDVLLPKIGKCRECHGPPLREDGPEVHRADFRCTECHRYHGGDAHGQGAVASVRGASIESSLGRFLLGASEAGDR